MSVILLAARAGFFLLLALVTYLTVTPDTGGAGLILRILQWMAQTLFGDAAFADKLAHFIAYGALGAAAFWARLSPQQRPALAPLALAVYGAALEGVQSMGETRFPELADGVANLAGALIGFYLARALTQRLVRPAT